MKNIHDKKKLEAFFKLVGDLVQNRYIHHNGSTFVDCTDLEAGLKEVDPSWWTEETTINRKIPKKMVA